MMQKRRSIATAAAVLAIAAALAGCTAAVEPAVSFAAETLTISLERMVVGEEVSVTLPEAMGGKQELVYSLVPKIPGLTFDPATRVLSGKPTMADTYDNMTYTAKDAATGGTMESVTFVITVDARPLSLDERIRGTWRNTTDWWDRDEVIGTYTDVLTFTKSRFILLRSHVSYDGSRRETWNQQGTWEISDREIVRIWYHNDNDMPTSLSKEYVFVGDDLLIHHWAEDGLTTSFDRMSKVSDPLPDLIGTWRAEGEDEGVRRTWTLEITTSTLTYIYTEQTPSDNEPFVENISGPWEHDPAKLFIWATPTFVSHNGEEVPDHETIGHRRRWAYAPTSGPTAIGVSPIWDEQQYDPQTESYSDNPDFPHGNYWLMLEKQ
jgi:hypothetical protein